MTTSGLPKSLPVLNKDKIVKNFLLGILSLMAGPFVGLLLYLFTEKRWKIGQILMSFIVGPGLILMMLVDDFSAKERPPAATERLMIACFATTVMYWFSFTLSLCAAVVIWKHLHP